MKLKRKLSLIMAAIFIANSLAVTVVADTSSEQANCYDINDDIIASPSAVLNEGLNSTVNKDNVEIKFELLNDWGSGYSAQIVISNDSNSNIEDWQLSFDFDYGIDSLWNGVITEHSENHYVINNAGYNSIINAGGSVTIGFNGSPGLVNASPDNYVLKYNGGEVDKSHNTETSVEVTTDTVSEATTSSQTGNSGDGESTWELPAIDNIFDYALFTGNLNNGIGLYTNNTYINGDVHSNNDFYFQGNKLEVNGICKSSGKISTYTSSSSNSYIKGKSENAETKEMKQLAGYACDYLVNKADVYEDWHNFNQGNVELSKSIICKQGVQFNTSTFVGCGTVYAKDSITYNVGSLATADDSKVFLVSENGDIVINGSDIEMDGILYAPNGVVRINAGSFRLNGRIIADRFEFNGTTLYINKGDADLDFIKWLFAPDITLNVSGEYKVNRKVVLDISESNEINRISQEKVVWEITDENGKAAVIAVDEENSDNFKKELLFKKAGKYTVKVYTGFEEQVITKEIEVVPDIAPKADFEIDYSKSDFENNEDITASGDAVRIMRNPQNDSKATVILKDKSFSPDNDTIGNRIWYCYYDTNNDGIFEENEKEIINDENNIEYVYETNKVGNLLIALEVKETYDNTIPKLLAEEDYLRDFTIEEENRGFEVGNIAPESKVEISKAKALDVAVTFGDTDRATKELYNERFTQLNNTLKEKGIDANVYALKTSAITAQDTFAWKEYSHPNTDRQTVPVIYDGNDIKMIGYQSKPFKDFLYIADEDDSQKIFTFDLQYGSNDWHSMEGGGFLFNTKVSDDENIIDGYCLLITRQGLSLISIDNSALDQFRNGRYNNVHRFGKLIQTFKLPVELRENHSLKIIVESDNISVWDNDISVMEKYPIEDKGHHGYGPIISHISHGCYQRSYFTFKNIRMETVSDKSLLEGLKENDWRTGAEKVLVNISNTPVGDLSTSEQAVGIAHTMLEMDMSFIGVGSNESVSQYSDFISLGGLDGYISDSGDIDLVFAQLEEYILNLFADKNIEVDPYVAIDDIVEYKDAYTDYENDPSYEQKWYYEHDPNVFESNSGYIDNNKEEVSEPMISFNKTGAYYTKLKVRDNPVGEYDALDEYRLWSDESVIQKIFIVHTRPVADFEVSMYANDEETCYANITENSYDPDHISSYDKGIKEKIYKWKNLKDAEWTEGILPNKLPVGEEFFVSLVVRDTEGDLSKPCIKLISTEEFKVPEIEKDNTPPEIFIEPNKMNLRVGEELLVYGYAIDDFGVDSFEMYINGKKVLENTGRSFYTPTEEGSIIITGKAVDLKGNASEKTVTVKVSDDRDKTKPVIKITSPLSGGVVSGNVNIVGSITDNVGIYKYVVTIKKSYDDTYYLISEGDSAVVNKVIAKLDTTQFENGHYEITITAGDTSGNTAEASVDFNIENVVDEPVVLSVRVVLEKDVINIDEDNTVYIYYNNTYEVKEDGMRIAVDGVWQDSINESFSFDTPGTHTITAEVTDVMGNTATGEAKCVVIDERDKVGPTAEITSPEHASYVNGTIDFIGTVSDDKEFKSYTISYRNYNDENETVFAEGTEEKINGILGTVDTTLVEDGIYLITLTAYDAVGNNRRTTMSVIVKNHTSGGDSSGESGEYKEPVIHITPDKTSVSEYETVTVDVDIENIENAQTIEVYIDDELVMEYAGTITFSDKAGTKTVKVKVVDTNGKEYTEEAYILISQKGGNSQSEINNGLTVSLSHSAANIGEQVTLYAKAADTSYYPVIRAYVDDKEVSLNNGIYKFTSDTAKTVKVKVNVTDKEGNTKEYEFECVFYDFADTKAPTAIFTEYSKLTVEDEIVLTASESIIGTVEDETKLKRYTLEYREKGSEEWKLLNEGFDSVIDSEVGVFDTTIIPNGLYELKLTAEDFGGNIAYAVVEVVVDSKLKLGRMKIGFTDLSTEVGGTALSVTRNYDSTNKTVGDFGYGWNMGLQGLKLYESNSMYDGYCLDMAGTGLSTSYVLSQTKKHNVTINYGNGEVDRFRLVLKPAKSAFIPMSATKLEFVCINDENTKLEIVGNNQANILSGLGEVTLYGDGSGANNDNIGRFDVQKYKLTRKDGTVIIIDKSKGIESITDRNGNTITVTENGYEHSSGKNVLFERDNEGRVTAVQNSDGSKRTYEYDENGDLVAAYDFMGNKVGYVYDDEHNLTEIIDPNGVAVARNVYDDEGRLVATIDANGKEIKYDHNISENSEVITDGNGNVTVYNYDERGNVTSVIDPYGNITKNEYDNNGNKISTTDVLGNTSYFNYDSKGNVTSVTNAEGVTVNSKWNEYGKIVSMSDINGKLIEFFYDSYGNPDKTVDAEGNVTDYTYTRDGELKSIVDTIGLEMKFVYDNDGNCVQMISNNGSTVDLTYDENGNCLSRTSTRNGENGAEKITEFYKYDLNGNATQLTDAEGNITRFEYNALNQQTAVIAPNGSRTEYEYDNCGNISLVRYADGLSESFEYDANGNAVSAISTTGETIKMNYDKLDRLTEIVYANGSKETFEYDAKGRLLTSTGRNGGQTRYEYDKADRNIAVIDPMGNRTEFTYNEVSRISEIKDARGNIFKMEYDRNGNQTKLILPDGTFRTTEYNGNSQIIKETDQSGNSTVYSYNEFGFLTSVTDAMNNKWVYTYDNHSNLTSVKDSLGNVTKYNYDKLGRCISTELAMGQKSEITYDKMGRVTETKDFNGNVAKYNYDAAGYLVSKTTNEGTISYNYENGRLSNVSDKYGITGYEYDNMGQLTKKTLPNGNYIAYEYDKAGQLTEVKTPYSTANYEYDLAGRITRVIDKNGVATVYEYDANGNRTAVKYANGQTMTYRYDPQNRLVEENITNGSQVVASYKYTLGASGQRIKAEENGRVVEYTYDNTYKLLSETVNGVKTSYEYDSFGNRTKKVENGVVTEYTYDKNNRLIKAGNEVYSYDDNGNLISATDGEKESTYTYDSENHLIKAKVTGGNGVTIETYEYDFAGNRIAATANEVSRTEYLVDDYGLAFVLAEIKDGAVTTYTYGQELISLHREDDKKYYLFDGQGSVRALSDVNGNITDTYTYDAFGNLVDKTGETENSFLYCGEQYDANTGFYYLRARYMDPSVGRFVTMDPYSGSIFDPISLHKYLYANANPIAYTDPTGYFSLAEFDVCSAIENILDNAAKVNYVKIFNTIDNALSAYDFVRTIYDSIINGESVEQIAISIAVGAITSVAINKCTLFENPIVKKIMSGVLATVGIAGEAQGIYEAIENGDYDLAITRSVQAAMTLTSALFFNCFTGETLVATADGQKRIDEIKVGDLVWSANIETGEVELKEVTEVFVREDNVLVHLTINGEVINTTALHPFYVVDKGWTEAIEINVGDEVLLQNGTTATVDDKTTEQFETPVKVYNFTVDEFHTYFVGEDCVLVHNANYHKHHSDPKYLGGDPKQPLTNIETQDHIDIHKEIDVEFPRWRGTEYYKNKLETEPEFNDEVIDKLTKIYGKWSDKYPTLLDDFLKNRRK